MSISKLLAVGLVMFASFFANTASPDGDTWLSYEPSIIELKGRLTTVVKFGPPNYGENPETDKKLEVPILQLSEPINVRGDAHSPVNTRSFENVTEVQLIFLRAADDYRRFVSKIVIVSGSLSQAVSGHHFTGVVMTVKAIREGK